MDPYGERRKVALPLLRKKKQRLKDVSEKRVKIRTWEPPAHVEIYKLLRRE